MINKIIGWIKLNIASILGVIQVVIKFIKEVLTAVVNLAAGLLIFIPSQKISGLQNVVIKVREGVNKIDALVEGLKEKLIPAV